MGMLESIEKILHDVADLFSANTEAGHNVVYVILIVLIAILCDVLCKLLINRLLLPIIRRTKFEWDDHLYDKKVVSRLAALAPAFILYAFLPSAFDIESSWYILTDRICKVYIIALILRFLNGVLNAFLDIFNEKESLRHYPIKGGVQTIQVILFSIGFISIIGTIIDHTVKVLNFDNTTTTIPPYALVTGSFTNWRSMFEGGGRRISRQILLDINSISFLREEDLLRFKDHFLIGEFVVQRLHSIQQACNSGNSFLAEELRVTNSMLFRVYLENYIRQMGKSNPEMLYMVRYLPMAERGLPVELYLFSAEKTWKMYEAVVADLIDHTIAVTAEFGLRLYQSPGSYDIQCLRERVNQI